MICHLAPCMYMYNVWEASMQGGCVYRSGPYTVSVYSGLKIGLYNLKETIMSVWFCVCLYMHACTDCMYVCMHVCMYVCRPVARGGGVGGVGRPPPPQLPIPKILFHPLAILFHPWNMWMTSHGQCPRGGGGGACECPRGGCFPIFRRADDVTRTMSKGGCL